MAKVKNLLHFQGQIIAGTQLFLILPVTFFDLLSQTKNFKNKQNGPTQN